MIDHGVVCPGDDAFGEEARLWDVLEQAPVGYQSLDAGGCVLDVNKAWLDMLGYRREDVAGRWFGEFVAPGQTEAFRHRFAAFLETGTADAELELCRGDGAVLPVHISGRVAFEGGRRVARTHCFVDDLGERRRVEAELRDREEQLQAVLDNSPFGMHTYRLEGERLVFSGFNQTAVAILGIDHAGLLGMTLEDAFPGDVGSETAVKTAAAYHRIAREGGRYESLAYAYDAGGIAGVFEVHAFAYGAGEIAVFFRDVTERRRLEAAVDESERRYRTLFENAREGLAVCSLVRDGAGEPVDWVYLEVNAEFTRIAGGQDVVGRRWSEAFPARAREAPELPRVYASVTDGAGAVEFEAYVASLGRWLRIAAFRLTPGTFVLAMEDITQRKRSETELEERERMLSTLLGNLPGMAYRCANDEQWTDEFVSDGAHELLGYPAGAKMEHAVPTLTAQVHPDDLDRIRRETADALARDERWLYTYRITDAGGTLKWVTERGVGVRDETGAVVALEGFIEDVTAQRRSEERLAAAAAQWSHTFDAMRDSVAVFDAEGRLVRANAGTARMLGMSADEMTGRPCFELFHGRQDFHALCPFLRSRESLRIAESIVEQDGSWLRVTFQPLLGDDGEFRGGVHVVTDISDLMLTEQRLRESVERLEAVTEAAIATIARAVEIRDPYTAGHQRRVSRLAEAVAVRMGLAEERVHGVRMAAIVHDVGKIVVPAEILAKPGRLTEMEMALIRHHARQGHDLLGVIDCPWPLAVVALQHHERVDGSGYPDGLCGDEIVLEARIIAVADVVEAMASDRPYRPALGIAAAVAEVEAARGVTLDEGACAVCLDILDEGFEFDG